MFATRKINKEYLQDHATYRLHNYLESIDVLDRYVINTPAEVHKRLTKEKYRHHQMNTLLRISFNFEESKQGFSYWADVSVKLYKEEDNEKDK